MNTPQIIELHNQRLLTTEQLAEFYETSVDRIKQNFNRNKGKFIEGKHYFCLEGDELKSFKSQVSNSDLPINKFASQLYLWTKRGASRHSKILNTDRAWDMYDELEETYFSMKEQELLSDPRTQLKLFYQFGEQTAVRVDTIEKDVSILKDTMRISGKQEADIQRAGKQKVIEVLGGKDSTAYESISKKVFANFWSEFKRYFAIPRYGELPCKQFDEALNFIDEWLPETAIRMEIHQLNRQEQLFRT